MKCLCNQHGSVLVFVTLMIVVLLVIVGMGLDTGQLAYTRSTGQSAVDAAALAAASGIPTGDETIVRNRATLFNAQNTFTDSTAHSIQGANVTLMQYQYDPTTKTATMTQAASISTANAARVALEAKNPYDAGATNVPIKSPLFLTPLFNLMGIVSQNTQNVSVNAVAVNSGLVGLPMAVEVARCNETGTIKLLQSSSSQGQGNSFNDNSGYTTYWINETNPNTIEDFLRVSNNCGGGMTALSGAGFCTNLNNGAIVSTYPDFDNLFRSNPGKCFLIPIVASGSDWSRCQNIMYFGKWCPDATEPVHNQGNDRWLNGTLTCPISPTNVDPTLKCFTQVLVRDKASGM
jgi:Flp pilus assembly protein TadG